MKNIDSEPTTLGQWILLEVREKAARTDGSICVSTLWLKRALNFMVEFFILLSDGMDTFDASQQAFKQKLAPWQVACANNMQNSFKEWCHHGARLFRFLSRK